MLRRGHVSRTVRRASLAVASLATLSTVRLAHAQQSAAPVAVASTQPSAAPVEVSSPPAAASAAPAAATPGGTPPAASPEVAEAARRLFREGAQLANQGRWEEARDRFLRALAVRPSPLLRFNLAIAAQNSGHFVEAIDQYRQFLLDDTDPANALRRHEAQTAITAIENVLATVVITVQGTDAASMVRLDGRPLPLALLGVEIPVDPTEHVIDAGGVRGSNAQQIVRLGEGATQRVSLTLDVPAANPSRGGTQGARASSPPSSSPPPARNVAAAPSTIERVRRYIEERAATADEFGRRRWARTFVAYAFQGMGSPLGLVGLGIRWAARPWFELEFQGGGGHPFGPGLGIFLSGRSPWSYRYALGLLIGVSTNITNIPRGEPAIGQPVDSCRPDSPFTPVWLYTAVTHEWRVSMGFTFRLALGVRYLVNNRELDDALNVHCTPRVTFQPSYLVLDPPNMDRAGIPVLPWLMFDVGYAI